MGTWSRRSFLASVITGMSSSTHLLQAATASESTLPVTGKSVAELKGFDELMTRTLTTHNAPGAALAITQGKRLVYARGFGYADKAKKTPVQPTSLFRIASISKPITAVAILQLVERKKLKLDDKVWELLQLGQPKDARWKKVTVLHLLQHLGGWDRGKSFDPMFRSVEFAKENRVLPPAMQAHIIHSMLKRPLDYDPGERYAYSNFGYCLLGRIIERISKQPYDAYVKKHLMQPLGMKTMQLGRTLPEGRAKQEVHYYDERNRTGEAVMGKIGERVPLPYGAWCLEAMDSHGAWIASAVELVRFASSFDDQTKSKLLNADSIQTMFARPKGNAGMDKEGKPAESYYGCGWSVRPMGEKGKVTAQHTGSLSGTSTMLVRRHDGLTWAVLFNSRNGNKNRRLSSLVDPLIHEAADKVRRWPTHDLF